MGPGREGRNPFLGLVLLFQQDPCFIGGFMGKLDPTFTFVFQSYVQKWWKICYASDDKLLLMVCCLCWTAVEDWICWISASNYGVSLDIIFVKYLPHCKCMLAVIKYFLNLFSFSLINLTRFSFFSLHLRAVFAWFNILPEAFFKLSTSFSEVWIPQKDTVFQEWAHWWHMQREHHLLATQYYFPVSSSKNLLCS